MNDFKRHLRRICSKINIQGVYKRHREMVVEYLTTTDNPAMAAASIKAFAHPFLDDRQFAKGSCELDRLISNSPLFKKT